MTPGILWAISENDFRTYKLKEFTRTCELGEKQKINGKKKSVKHSKIKNGRLMSVPAIFVPP